MLSILQLTVLLQCYIAHVVSADSMTNTCCNTLLCEDGNNDVHCNMSNSYCSSATATPICYSALILLVQYTVKLHSHYAHQHALTYVTERPNQKKFDMSGIFAATCRSHTGTPHAAARQRRYYPCYLETNQSQQVVKLFHRHSKAPTEYLAIKA